MRRKKVRVSAHRFSVVFEHLSGLLVGAELFYTLPLQVVGHHQLQVPAVIEQRAGQEGGGRLGVRQHWGSHTQTRVERQHRHSCRLPPVQGRARAAGLTATHA